MWLKLERKFGTPTSGWAELLGLLWNTNNAEVVHLFQREQDCVAIRRITWAQVASGWSYPKFESKSFQDTLEWTLIKPESVLLDVLNIAILSSAVTISQHIGFPVLRRVSIWGPGGSSYGRGPNTPVSSSYLYFYHQRRIVLKLDTLYRRKFLQGTERLVAG